MWWSGYFTRTHIDNQPLQICSLWVRMIPSPVGTLVRYQKGAVWVGAKQTGHSFRKFHAHRCLCFFYIAPLYVAMYHMNEIRQALYRIDFSHPKHFWKSCDRQPTSGPLCWLAAGSIALLLIAYMNPPTISDEMSQIHTHLLREAVDAASAFGES